MSSSLVIKIFLLFQKIERLNDCPVRVITHNLALFWSAAWAYKLIQITRVSVGKKSYK